MKNKSLRKKRYFQNEWLEKYHCFSYHLKKQSAFCTVCTDYAQPNDSSPFIYRVDADGFKNRKKGGEKLFYHAKSRFHKNAAENVKYICTSQAVNVQLNNRLKHLQNLRQQGFFSPLCTLKLLVRQGLAIQGKIDDESNLTQPNMGQSKIGHRLAASHQRKLIFFSRNDY